MKSGDSHLTQFVSFCFPGVLAFPCGPSLACPLSLSLIAYFIFLYSWFFFVAWPGLPGREPFGAVGGRGGGFLLISFVAWPVQTRQ